MTEYRSTEMPSTMPTGQSAHELASKGQRFINYFVDTCLYYFLLYKLFTVTGNLIAGNTVRDILHPLVHHTGLVMVAAMVSLPAMYTFFEGFTQGRSPGKYITGTMAINHDLSPLTFKKAFVRSMLRLVPIDVISGLFGPPIHDRWSNTMVVKKNSIVF